MDEFLDRYLGPANNEGNEMTQWVLNISRQVLPRRSLRRLQPDELSSEVEISKRADFDSKIKISHGDSFTSPAKEHMPNPQYPWDGEDRTIPIPEAGATDEKGTSLSPNSIVDTLINAKVVIPRAESDNLAKVVRRSLDFNEQGIGNHNKDPILNTCIYGVEFQYGIIAPYAEKIIDKIS